VPVMFPCGLKGLKELEGDGLNRFYLSLDLSPGIYRKSVTECVI